MRLRKAAEELLCGSSLKKLTAALKMHDRRTSLRCVNDVMVRLEINFLKLNSGSSKFRRAKKVQQKIRM